MSHNIASKIGAVAIAVVMNGVVLGGVSYLFASHTQATPTSAQCQSDDATEMPAAHLRQVIV
jgi:hypothetical protein